MKGKVSINKTTVKDIMTSPVSSLNTVMTIKEAITFLIENKMSGAPLLRQDGELVSVVSEMDLMRLGVLENVDTKLAFCVEKLPKISKLITITKDKSFAELFKLFLENQIRRVLVIDSRKRPIGIVARRDILKAYLTHVENE